MTPAEFVADLTRRGVRLSAENGRLRCTAPRGVLDPKLLAAIDARKPDLLRFLRAGASIPAADRRNPLPLSPAQQRLWLLHQLEPCDTAYNIPLMIRLDGPVGPSILEHAVNEVVRRHEVLRTRYPARKGRPRQEIAEYRPDRLPIVDLSGLAADRRAEVAADLAAGEANRPFDLVAGPSWRPRLLRYGPAVHRLLLTRHHIVTDGWSLGVLLGELGELYLAAADGRPAALAEPPIQYADFAAWQVGRAEDPEMKAMVDRWRRRLDGASPSFGLVAERSAERPDERPDERPADRAETVARTLPAAVTERLREVARKLDVTLSALLLTAYGTVLGAAAREPSITVGTAVAGRTRPELEHLIGCFVNMLPLRLDLDGAAPFAVAVARTHAVLVEGLAGQEVPFERLVEELRPERTLSGNPLFQVAFVLQNTPTSPARLPGIAADVEETVPVAPKFALTLVASESGDALDVVFEFDPTRLDRVTVDELAERFTALLGFGAADPEASCARLLRRAAVDLGAVTGPTPVDDRRAVTGLDAVFADRAAGRPDSVAVSDAGGQLTYGALHERAGRLAAALRAAGIGPERLVGLLAEPSSHLIVGILGILRAGGAYVPLDPADPPERLAAIAADAGIDALVAPAESAGRIPGFDGPAIPLTDADQWPRNGLPDERGEPGRLAYIIYTSGSTGTPKGVMVSHESVASLLTASERVVGSSPDDVWTLAHSFAFDFSVWEMWGAFASGGRLVILPRATVRAPFELWDVIRTERVTVLSQTPSAFRQLAPAALAAGGIEGGALRCVVLGGEACPPAQLAHWLETLGAERPRLINMYGITETTIHATHRALRVDDVQRSVPSPIGVGLPGARVDVVDAHGTPVPRGGRGEIVVGGWGVARGYRNRPGRTAERFRPDDLSGRPGERLYMSGDQARLLPDGELTYLGRLDAQVKLRGFRIEPGEVEAALVRHPKVRAAAVTLRHDRDRPYLAAHIVPAGPEPPGEPELRRFLADRLPRYMIPAAFVPMNRLPLTRNGKLDTAALPDPIERDDAAPPTPPRTETERALAGLWGELLGVAAIDIHENFFDMGGDSLLITQFHARVVEAFGIDLPMRRVYGALDIASLAETVDRIRSEADARRLERLVTEIEQMPEEELRRRLG